MKKIYGAAYMHLVTAFLKSRTEFLYISHLNDSAFDIQFVI